MTCKPGDTVKIITDKEEFEGVLMPRPDLLQGDFIVLKLGTGYNIGIKTKHIKEIKLLKAYKSPVPKDAKLKHDKSLPTVSVLSTGGTISSKVDYRTGGVYADYGAEDFVDMCPELADIANIRAKKIMQVMTEDMDSSHWQMIAKEVSVELNDPGVSGVVVTMGTDILHYVAAVLSFMLKDLNKPVIVTASQRSIDRGSSDAFMNLSCAVTAAVKVNVAEVMSCMHGSTNDDYCLLIRGTKVRKMHTSRRDAFRPINDLPIAKVWSDKIEMINPVYHPRTKGKVELVESFEPKIALIQVFPCMDPGVINFYLDKGCQGIILAATALGHVPTDGPNSLIPFIKRSTDKKIPVFITTQSLYGRTNQFVYSNLRKVSIVAGGIYLDDILPETAFVKLGWVLGQTKDFQKVKDLMLKNIAGEFQGRSLPDTFLS